MASATDRAARIDVTDGAISASDGQMSALQFIEHVLEYGSLHTERFVWEIEGARHAERHRFTLWCLAEHSLGRP